MGHSRKVSNRYHNKLARVLTEIYPDSNPVARQVILERAAAVPTFVQATFDDLSTEDLTHFPAADMFPEKRDGRGTVRIGWCQKHAVFHRYAQQALRERVYAERDAALAQVSALDPSIQMPHQLWDILVNPYSSYLRQLLAAHYDDMTQARVARSELKRTRLAEIYDAFPYDIKRDFYICGRKTPFATADEAAAMLRSLPKSTPRIDTLSVYKCDTCDTYHLGHSDKRGSMMSRTPSQMLHIFDYAWTQNYSKARKYAIRRGYDVEPMVTHADLLN